MGLVRFFENVFVKDDYSVERTFENKGLNYLKSQDKKLKKSCKTKSYRLLMFILHYYLYCSFLKIRILDYKKPAPLLTKPEEFQDESDEDSASLNDKLRQDKPKCLKCYCLTVNNPFTISDLSWSTFLPKLLKAAILLSLFYVSFKLFVVAFLKLRYDSILDVYAPKVVINGTIIEPTPRCALPGNIKTNLGKIYDEQYKNIEKRLIDMGDPIISLTGVGSIIAITFAMISLFFFIAPFIYMFFLKYGAVIHSFAMLKDPIRMREKILYDLFGLCLKIKNALIYGGNLFDDDQYEEQDDDELCEEGYGKMSEDENTLFDGIDYESEVELLSDTCRRRSSVYPDGMVAVLEEEHEEEVTKYNPILDVEMKRKKFTDFIEMLQDIKRSNIIEPSNSTANYHKGTIKLYLIISVMAILQGWLLTSMTILFMIYYELVSRVDYRLNLLECEQHLTGSIPVKYHAKLIPFKDFNDEWAYMNYDNKSLYDYYLNLGVIEMRYLYEQPMVIVSLIEYGVVFFLSTFWMALLTHLFMASNSHALVWLNQIESQVEYCTKMIEKQIKTVQKSTTEEKPPPPSPQRLVPSSANGSVSLIDDESTCPTDLDDTLGAMDDRRIFRLVAISYVNFELYRTQQKSQQGYLNFFFMLIIFNTGVSLYFCYMANRNLQPDYMKYLLFQVTIMVQITNAYLITGSLFTDKMLSLMKKVTKLITVSNYKRNHCEHNIIELWRRQVMPDSEMKKAYATSFLGIYVTFDKLITINSWLVLLWMYLLFRAPDSAYQAPNSKSDLSILSTNSTTVA